MSPLTSIKIRYAIVAGIVTFAVGPSFGATDLAATPHHKHVRVTPHLHAHPIHHLVRANGPANGYGQTSPGAPFRPGYVFLPGKGIVGESCDMPTSTCPDTERDTQ